MTTAMSSLAIAASALLLVAIAFQLGLAAGAPWGRAAYGGRVALADGTLPVRHRAASLVTAAVLLVVGWVLLLRGGVLGTTAGHPGLSYACWGFAALFALNTAGNVAGRHPLERWGMGALTACLAVACVLLAVG
ncbi:hypothetical protein [Terracoccus sp. 273MFTsu3.1]|uniref:hypothetical protein n=1 Tax=Terracoccus sp. 273MFTsu3.1 TaxID=1172188 RepID=UPI00036BFAA0|nr:hypothetical protein [Terracoccus sp. 273MFTsu3.1]